MNQNEVFLTIGIITISVGLVHYLSKKCLQSKCEDINCCWNFIHIKRNIRAEENEHKFDIENNRDESISGDYISNINNVR